MKILVFTTHANWNPHFETDLEIIQRHLDDGDEVVHLRCDAEMPACEINPRHAGGTCRQCMQGCKRGLGLLSSTIPSISFLKLTQADRRELAEFPKTFASQEKLASLTIENFDIGAAVLSSIISLERNPAIDTRIHHDLIARFVTTSLLVYRSLQNHLDAAPMDRVYVFNGRLAPCRAVLRACQSRGVTCFTHERGHDLHHYELFENTTPLDIAYAEKDIHRYWVGAAADLGKRQAMAEKFYLDRARGMEQSWYSFVSHQKKGLLPVNWDPSRKNLVIFNSSEDEFASIGPEWRNPIYPTQLQGLAKIIESLKGGNGRFHVYLRIHPNLKKVKNADTEALWSLQADFLTVIAPEDPTSTYALIQNADKVLTFGSTVGIEAVFWGKPSILAGMSFYRNLGGTYNPRTHDELMDMLAADLPPKSPDAALMYGHYMQTYGIPFKRYAAASLATGRFKGTQVHIAFPRLRRAMGDRLYAKLSKMVGR